LKSVRFVGRVPPDQIAEHYAANDIYVQTPNIDNTPTSVLEAYASGLPVVSTRAGGVPAILRHGEHGLLADVDDHLAIAGHVLALLDNPASASGLARRARAACEAYTWPAVREQWIRVYRGVLGSSPGGAADHPPAALPLGDRS
jgi:glycosyltransferase involved in cell wall biosynthesis